jgi:septal ring factor EnvC (AmiA/AmiB activator)
MVIMTKTIEKNQSKELSIQEKIDQIKKTNEEIQKKKSKLEEQIKTNNTRIEKYEFELLKDSLKILSKNNLNLKEITDAINNKDLDLILKKIGDTVNKKEAEPILKKTNEQD